MVGFYGIGPVPGPANTTHTQGPAKRPEDHPGAQDGDAAVFSRTSEDLAVALQAKQPDAYEKFREERIEEARQNLADGLHQVQGLIEVVASRISPYIDSGVE